VDWTPQSNAPTPIYPVLCTCVVQTSQLLAHASTLGTS
jgi:hypothetical protein